MIMKSNKIALAVTAVAAMIGVAACGLGSNDPLAAGGSSGTAGAGTIIVGSANFPESALLAQIYADALIAKGVKVQMKLNIGSRETYIPALQDGSIDLIPEYTGVLDQSSAQDKDAVVVTKETATKMSLKSIADLGPYAKGLILGGPPEWQTRPTGVPGLKKVYGLEFKSFLPLDAGGPLSVEALKDGQVDAVNLFTTDPFVAANGFVILNDPKNLFAAQNIVPLITKSKVNPTVSATLNAISARLDTVTLGELVKEVVIDREDATVVAREFLTKNGLG